MASAQKTPDDNKSAIYHIDPKTISVRKNWNCRDFKDPANLQHVEQLAESIKEAGVKEPMTVVMEGKTPVLVNGDTTDEADETFFVRLSGAVNANTSQSPGVGTILDDDGSVYETKKSVTVN